MGVVVGPKGGKRAKKQKNKKGRYSKMQVDRETKAEEMTRWSATIPWEKTAWWEKWARNSPPRAIINFKALKTSIKIFPSSFYSSWMMVKEWSGGINNSRWRPGGQTNASPQGGWSLKPAHSTSWEAGQNHTARLMRDDEEQGDGAWSSAVTTLWINNAKVGHM